MPATDVLVAIKLPPGSLEKLQAEFTVHFAPTPAERAKVYAEHGAKIGAVLSSGSRGFTADDIAALPNLGLICAHGAGFENIAADAAKAHGIVVTHSVGNNNATVADHAMGLLIAVVRAIPRAERTLREGRWETFTESRPAVHGKKLGILGLGAIGAAIARRAASFDMTIRYHNRTRRADVAYEYEDSPAALAAASDFLVIACPGGPATRHLVNREVLKALGPKGYVVNVGRGTVIDTEALIAALTAGEIAGAALDVLDGEPRVPEALLAFPNVVLTPHFGGRSPESAAAGIDQVIANMKAFFARLPVLTPIP